MTTKTMRPDGTPAGERFEAGLKTRREVLGDAYVNASVNKATDYNWPMQQLVTEYCWGDVWNREGLGRRERSILNLGMISALGRSSTIILPSVSRRLCAEAILRASGTSTLPTWRWLGACR